MELHLSDLQGMTGWAALGMLLIAALVGLLILRRPREQSARGRAASGESISVKDLPSVLTAPALLAGAERDAAWPIIKSAASDFVVCPRLSLGSLLKGEDRQRPLKDSIARTTVDYAIYAPETFELVCVIFMSSETASPRSKLVKPALLAAGINVMHMVMSDLPDPATLRAHLLLQLEQRRIKLKQPLAARVPRESVEQTTPSRTAVPA